MSALESIVGTGMKYIAIIVVIIIIAGFFIFPSSLPGYNNFFIDYNKPYLWLYWEGPMPDYIQMCYDTIKHHASNSFNVILLNENNIKKYLTTDIDLSKLSIAHKVDYYRICLLEKYGGVYMDMDIILLSNLDFILEKLKTYDYVGFGCTGVECTYGKWTPSNWMMASKPHTQLMKNIKQSCENKILEFNTSNKELTKDNYHDFGKLLLWKELNKLKILNNYDYYHFDSSVDGTRDTNGKWVSMDRIFSDEQIIYENKYKMKFLVLYNSELDDKYKTMTKEELLNTKTNFIKFYKKSMR